MICEDKQIVNHLSWRWRRWIQYIMD